MTAAPVSREMLAPALLPFGEGTMLPAEAYTSEAVLAWERRHLFAGFVDLPRAGRCRLRRRRDAGGDHGGRRARPARP